MTDAGAVKRSTGVKSLPQGGIGFLLGALGVNLMVYISGVLVENKCRMPRSWASAMGRSGKGGQHPAVAVGAYGEAIGDSSRSWPVATSTAGIVPWQNTCKSSSAIPKR